MVLLTSTPQILSALALLPEHHLSSLPSPSTLPSKPGDPIPHKTLIILSRLLRSTSASSTAYTLNTLLRNAHPYTPPPPTPTPKSPEYLALMTRLRFEQEQREYRSLLTANPSPGQNTFQLSSEEQSDEKDDISPSLVINILLSIVMCGAAMFYMTRWWGNDGVRVLVSLGVAIVVGIAEVVVYAGYLRKVKESRQKERRIREKKVVVGSERVGGSEGRDEGEGGVEMEKEEIWGRGVNGGMRRRVREKWEREEESRDMVREK